MACPDCTPTKTLPTCWFTLIVGDISPAQDVDIYVKNHTTGKVIKQQLDAVTQLWVDLTDPADDFYNPYSTYEIWATPRDNPNNRLTITTDDASTSDTCFQVNFENMDGGPVADEVYTVPVADLVLEAV